jgi:elongation factor 3
MNVYKNYDISSIKKTCVDEKLQILNSIEDTCDDEFKFKIFSYLIHLTVDKNMDVQTKSKNKLDMFAQTMNPYLIKSFTKELIFFTDSDKPLKMRINALNMIIKLSESLYFKESIPILVEPISYLLAEYSKELSESAIFLYSKMLDMIDNKDIIPLKEYLINGLTNPQNLNNTVDKITSTTFVQAVDNKTLSIIVPILTRTFRNVPYAVKRQSIIIIENMTKLVQDEMSAYDFIVSLMPLIKIAQEDIPDPEVRNVANRVFNHLIKIKERGEKLQKEQREHIEHLKSFMSNLNQYNEEIIETMINTNTLDKDNIMKFLDLNDEESQKIFDEFTKNFNRSENEEIITAEELCNITFTLGYGSKVLLHQTKLQLYRGFKYGLIGPNNSGKTTLMRSMASQQLESFPSELKSVFVETDILGELSHLSLTEYIKQDKRLENLNLTEEHINETLQKIGFTNDMMRGGVSSLSGGWRMKLALARAMMQHADILLMDEPTAHLDVINVKWLLDYINSLTDVTCIIVSQNSKLLDSCCTHIIKR